MAANDDRDLSVNRAAIQGSGTDGLLLQPPSQSESSVITDAGDQQFKRQREVDSRQTWASSDNAVTQLSAYEASDSMIEHELSFLLFGALQKTRDSREKGFLPKSQLERLVTVKSAARELRKCLPSAITQRQIKKIAQTVCKEIHVKDRDKVRIKSYRKIFALLVLVEKSASISHFLEEDVSDLDLPLTTDRKGGFMELRRRDSSGKPSSKRLRCFDQWTPVPRRNFEEYQWTMLAPFFSQGEYNYTPHYILKDEHILPFTSTEDQNEYEGGFGRVFMVKIHPDHHKFRSPDNREPRFAIKQLQRRDSTSFKREVDILKKFTGANSHKHVVSLLATYEQFNKYHLMFHWADENLFNYWQKIKPNPGFNYENVLWLAEQCAGIADGLSKLHRHHTFVAASSVPEASTHPSHDADEDLGNPSALQKDDQGAKASLQASLPVSDRSREPGNDIEQPFLVMATTAPNRAPHRRQPHGERKARPVNERLSGDKIRQWGRHGDIKPENILWFDGAHGTGGLLKISDFGESELNSRLSKTKRRSSVVNTRTYSPPECDLETKIIRQSSDIWSLGCVFMEFVTWMLGGVDLWRDFARRRQVWDPVQKMKTDTFFEIFITKTGELRVKVKDAVTQVKPPSPWPNVNCSNLAPQFFETLHSHPNCTEFFHGVLNMIQDDMIIVESETVCKTRRMYCEEVTKSLMVAYRKCKATPDYAMKKGPWTGKQLAGGPSPRSVKLNIKADGTMTALEFPSTEPRASSI